MSPPTIFNLLSDDDDSEIHVSYDAPDDKKSQHQGKATQTFTENSLVLLEWSFSYNTPRHELNRL